MGISSNFFQICYFGPRFLAFLSILCFFAPMCRLNMLCRSGFYFVFAKSAISHVMGNEKVRKNIVFSRNKEIFDQQGMRKGITNVKNR